MNPITKRRATDYRYDSAAARNIAHVTDMHRVPFSVALDFLARVQALDRDAFALAWLTLTLGMDADRIARLTIASESNFVTIEPILDPDKSTLTYTVLDTGGQHHAFPQPCHITAPIPVDLSHYLADNIATWGNNVVARLARIAKAFGRSNPGCTPVPSRLRNAFPLLIANHGLSPVDSALVAGETGLNVRGPAHYYHPQPKALAFRYHGAVTKFIEKIIQALPSNHPLAIEVARYVYPDVSQDTHCNVPWQVTFTKLREFFEQFFAEYDEQVLRWKCAPVSTAQRQLVDIYNMQQAYLFCLQILTLGLRPTGKSTAVGLQSSSSLALVRDKASARYRERHLSAVCLVFRRQLDACRLANRQLADRLGCLTSTSTRDQVSEGEVLARYCDGPYTRGQPCRLRRMRGTDFRAILSAANLWLAHGPQTNSLRHSLASILSETLPYTHASQFMGHQCAGFEPEHPWSTSDCSWTRNVRDAVTELASLLRLRTLHVPEAP